MISDAVPQTTFNKTHVKFSCNYNESSLPPQVLISTWFDCRQTGFLKGTLGNSESCSNASHTHFCFCPFLRDRDTRSLTWRPSCSPAGVWVADFHTQSRFPGEERNISDVTEGLLKHREVHATVFFLEWSGLFSAPGSMFIFHKPLSDNVSFCWHWASRSQRLIETRTD